jgi:hypothetical protein
VLRVKQVESFELRGSQREADLVAERGDLRDGDHDLATVEHALVHHDPGYLPGLYVKDQAADGTDALAVAVHNARAERYKHDDLLCFPIESSI